MRFSEGVQLYGLLSLRGAEVVDWFPTREEAEDELERILADNPAWSGELQVVEMHLELSMN